MFLEIPGAIWVLGIVIVIAFLSVIGIMVLGSRDSDTHPVTASDSHAVAFWSGLSATTTAPAPTTPTADTAEKSEPVAAVLTSAGVSTGQAVSDLSEDEKEAKRQAALERKKAREAKG